MNPTDYDYALHFGISESNKRQVPEALNKHGVYHLSDGDGWNAWGS